MPWREEDIRSGNAAISFMEKEKVSLFYAKQEKKWLAADLQGNIIEGNPDLRQIIIQLGRIYHGLQSQSSDATKASTNPDGTGGRENVPLEDRQRSIQAGIQNP